MSRPRTHILDIIGRPGCLILAGGIVGYLVGNWWGLVFGLVGGYVLALVLGGVVALVWGGPLPKDYRDKIVSRLLSTEKELVKSVFPGKEDSQIRACVDESIREVFRKTMSDNAAQGEYAMARANVWRVCQELAETAESELKADYWDALWSAIELEAYPE